MENKKEEDIQFKIITIGDSNVGKTSIINRYILNAFQETKITTIGFNLSFKNITLKNGKRIKLKLIDTLGQERYKSLNSTYFKNSDVIFFVFALDNIQSFENINSWIKIFQNNCNNINILKYLIGNKNDLDIKVPQDDINSFIKKNNDFKYKSISAKKENNEINELFDEIGEELYKDYEENGGINKRGHNIQLSEKKKEKKNCKMLKCIV